MHIDEFLKQSFVIKPENGAVGEESDWLDFCDLQVGGKSIWVSVRFMSGVRSFLRSTQERGSAC